MKYLVMECHESYAVLMDEQSRFVKAANLHYEVGQTVTDPVLMEESSKPSITRSVIVKAAAAAACLVLIGSGGFYYYNSNMRTRSVVTIDGYVEIEMALNSHGKVISISSNSEQGKELLKNYEGKNKDSIVAANELIALQKEHGLLKDSDTVELIIENADPSYKADLEQELSKLTVNVNVQSAEEAAKKAEDKIPEPPVPPVENKIPDEEEPPKPHEEQPDKHETPAVPEPPKPDDVPQAGNEEHPEPPAPPADKPGDKPAAPPSGDETPPVPPEPPKQDAEKPDVKPGEPSPPQPPDNAAPPEAPAPAEGEAPPPIHPKIGDIEIPLMP